MKCAKPLQGPLRAAPSPLLLLLGRPGAVWLEDSHGPILTRGEAAGAVREGARALCRAGLRPGDRAGWLPCPTASSLLQALSLLEAGAELALMPLRETPAVVEEETRRLDLAMTATSRGGVPFRRRPGGSGKGRPTGRQGRVLVRSSGSTGEARWLRHSLGGLLTGALALNRHLGLRPTDAWLLSLPLDHVGGFAILVRSLAGPFRLRLPGSGGVAEDLAAGGITRLSLVPTQLHRLLEEGASPAGLASVLVGGAGLPRALRGRAGRKAWPLTASYGASETGAAVCVEDWPPGLDEIHAPSPASGRPLAPHRLRVDDEGMVEVSSPALFEAALDADGVVRPRMGSWWRSGDLARWRRGRLEVLGRVGRLINSGGEKVNPEEVEEALLELPMVLRAAVVAVDDAAFGQRPAAFIDWGDAPPLELAGLRRLLDPILARHKHPAHLWAWPAEAGEWKPRLAHLTRLAGERLSLDAGRHQQR